MRHLPIRPVQMPRRTQPHTRHRPSTQERGVGGGSEAGHRGEWACGGAQAGHLLRTLHGGGLTPRAVREHPVGRHLGLGVERAAVLGKAADHPDACGPMGGLDARRVSRPAEGEVRGAPEGPLSCSPVDALPQGHPRGLQRTPQRTPECEGRREGGASWTQPSPPGQGWASAPQAA